MLWKDGDGHGTFVDRGGGWGTSAGGLGLVVRVVARTLRALTRSAVDGPADDVALDSLGDAALIERLMFDDGALRVLVQRHDEPLRQYATTMLTNPAEIDQAVLATFVMAHRRAGSFPRAASGEAWLRSICARECLHRGRGSRGAAAPFEPARAVSRIAKRRLIDRINDVTLAVDRARTHHRRQRIALTVVCLAAIAVALTAMAR